MFLDESQHFPRFGVPAKGSLGIEQVAVYLDFEPPTGRFYQAQFRVRIVLLQLGRQTGGPWLVVSDYAVFDGYQHGASSVISRGSLAGQRSNRSPLGPPFQYPRGAMASFAACHDSGIMKLAPSARPSPRCGLSGARSLLYNPVEMIIRHLLTAAALLALPAPALSQAAAGWGDELPRPDSPVAVDSAGPDSAWPAPPLVAPPAELRAIYLNAWVFGGQRFHSLVALADTTEINAFVIDVKDDTGYLTYTSSVPTAIEIGANGERRARDTRDRLNLLHSKGIYPIARIVVAKDPLLAQQKPAWSVRHKIDGGLWRDRLEFAWVDAYNDSVWTYAADLAVEALEMGFSEIQFDYVRFPDEPRSRMQYAIFPSRRAGESTRSGVVRNLRLLRRRMHEVGASFTIDVFGMTASADRDLGVGQVWEDLVTTADVVLPMIYPSHYYDRFYGISHPNSEPYRVVRHALRDALEKNAALGVTTQIRPYLQAFTLGRPRYTPWHVREQIRAAEELGIRSWVLWNPRGVYDPAVFRPAVEPAEGDLPRAIPAGN